MDLRVLRPGDDELFGAAVSTFRDVDLADPSAFLTDPTCLAVVAAVDTTVIGWAWGTRQRHACGYTQVQLYEIEVLPEHRRRGVGRTLLRQFVDMVKSEGHRRMWLFTDETNAAAQALYLAEGAEASQHDDAAFWWQLVSR